MKIFLLTDYFYPFNPGGSEWSVYELAKSLKKKMVDAVIVTLNYGASEREIYGDLKIIRLPFIKKIDVGRKIVNPAWQNNPIFFAISAFQIYRAVKSEKPDIIHVQGKFLIPGAILAGFVTKKPVIVTIRDKQIICPIGKCFFEKNRLQACKLTEYITSDLPWYFTNYSQRKSFMNFTYVAFGVLYNRFMFAIIKFFANRAKLIITISQSQKKYLEVNGFSNVKVIYNTADFLGSKSSVQKTKSVLFAGKLSKGKGGEILINSIPDLVKKNKIVFLFAGTIELKRMFNEKLAKRSFKRYIKVLNNLSHRKLINLCCLRKQLSTNGYAFSYIKMNKFKGRPKQKHRTANKLILVEKIETGESHTFESCRAIAFILKLDRKEVGKCANGKMESYKGYKFNYINK